MSKHTMSSGYLLHLVIGCLTLSGLYTVSVYNYLLFHCIIEFFSIFVAFGMFIISWNARQFMKNSFLLFLGIAFIFVGSLDFLHTLSYKGMRIFEGYDANLPTQLWITARYLESLSLLIAPLLSRRSLDAIRIFYTFLIGTVFIVISIFLQIFPDCFIEGTGLTAFKTVSEYLICFILMSSAAILLKKRHLFEPEVWRLIIWSLILTIGSEFTFTLYIHVYGFFNLSGHILKFFSFYLLYKAMIETGLKKPYNVLFKNLKQNEKNLRQERDRAQRYLDVAAVMIVVLNAEGIVTLINKRGCEILGYQEQDILGKNWFEHIIPQRERDERQHTFSQFFSGSLQAVEYVKNVVLTKDGEERIIAWYHTALPDEQGDITSVLGAGEDVTDQKIMEKNLWIAIAIQKQRTFELEVLTQMSNALQSCLHEQETYEVVINACKQTLPGSSGCLCLLNDSQKTMRTAGTWGKISPQPKIFNVNDCVELRQNNHHTPLSSSCNDGFCQHMAFPSESIHWCIPLKTPEEILGVLHLSIPPSSKNGISEKDEEILQLQNMAIMRIAEQYVLSLANLRLREKLEVEAVRDPLTGLYNRRYMEASLKREWARAERRSCTVAILMLDIDHFKKVNDTYGHNVGDIVLQELGSLLQRHIRTEDIACRYGGEEFLLIMPEISLEIAKYRAEELRVMIKELRISYQKILLTITVSIGIALFPTHGNNLNDVIHTADAALYRAKKGGRDRVEIALT